MKARQLAVLTTTIITLSATHAFADDSNKDAPMVNPALWGAGIPLVVIGGLTTTLGATAVVVAASLPCNFLEFGVANTSCDRPGLDLGAAVLVAGLSVATLGAIFIFVGGARKSAETASISLVPTATTHGGGVSFGGRF
jgi:hypothetical protein